MQSESLESLNIEIGRREAGTDAEYFEKLLAPAFAMRRANERRDVVDRKTFLDALRAAEKKPRETSIEKVSLVGEERAVVSCVVKMDERRYHNLRVFVRNPNPQGEDEPAWLLLAWANEPLAGR
jgi:hypothetical protein